MKKLKLEDYLHSIDVKLKDKTKKDIYMIYIMIFAGLFAFSYLFFWETSLQSFEQKLQQIETVKRKIADDKRYLQYNTPAVIAALDKRIKETQAELIKYKDYNAYIKNKIETISFLLYDERVWGEYLNSVDQKARRYGIKILELSNKYNLTGDAFGHVLDISIDTKGRYLNTLKFLNSLEQSDLVVDVHDLNISAKDFLGSKINISVWGIRY